MDHTGTRQKNDSAVALEASVLMQVLHGIYAYTEHQQFSV